MICQTNQACSLQPTVQQRETFARLLVHDMRNPLSGIVLSAQLLQKRGDCNAEQERFLNQILAEAQRLRTLLDQMQLFNKLQQGQQRLRRQRTDPRPLLREAINKGRSAQSMQGRDLLITIPTAPIPQLLINRPLLQRLFDILLDHAIRFTPEAATITVDMRVAVGDLGKESVHKENMLPLVQITITDQGPSLPEQVLPNLYELVEKWDVVVSERIGIGLSLALCQMIAEIHDGTFTITNHRPQGVCYGLLLPIPASEWALYTDSR